MLPVSVECLQNIPNCDYSIYFRRAQVGQGNLAAVLFIQKLLVCHVPVQVQPPRPLQASKGFALALLQDCPLRRRHNHRPHLLAPVRGETVCNGTEQVDHLPLDLLRTQQWLWTGVSVLDAAGVTGDVQKRGGRLFPLQE